VEQDRVSTVLLHHTERAGLAARGYAVILSLIAATTMTAGLTVESCLDTTNYPVGIKTTKEEMGILPLEPDAIHGEWNYIYPHPLPRCMI